MSHFFGLKKLYSIGFRDGDWTPCLIRVDKETIKIIMGSPNLGERSNLVEEEVERFFA